MRQISVAQVRMARAPAAQHWVTALDQRFVIRPAWEPHDLAKPLDRLGIAPDVFVIDARCSRLSVVCRVTDRLHQRLRARVVVVVDAMTLDAYARRLPTVEFLASSASADEVRARIQKVARFGWIAPGPAHKRSPSSRVGIDWRTHEITLGTRRVCLTLRELQFFEALLQTFPQVTPAESLAGRAWGVARKSSRERAAAHVCSLRKKLAWFGADVGIRTVRGEGYALESRYPTTVSPSRK